MKISILIFLALFPLTILLRFYLDNLLFKYTKINHPELYKELGYPSHSLNGHRYSPNYWFYIYSPKHKNVEDLEFQKHCKNAKRAANFSYLVVLSFVVLMIMGY